MTDDGNRPRAPRPVEARVERLLTPLQRFIATNVVSSGLLLASAVAALVLANSPLAEEWEHALHMPMGLRVGGWSLEMSLLHWLDDGLMALFFFLLGLEIKRELLAGNLRDPARARMLVVTALGGMVLPAGLYALLAPAEARAGWGIPMATDTAFAIGVMAAVGSRAPRALVAFLVGLAIVDDIGAVLVIAVFYTESIDTGALLGAAGALGALILCNVIGLRRPMPYLLLGAVLWYAVLMSGVHATIAGVLTAATVPARTRTSRPRFERRLVDLVRRLRRRQRDESDILADPIQHELVDEVRREARRATTPLQRWESNLETPIALLILPMFALANAGVAFEGGGDLLGDRLVWAIVVSLVGGKLIGITGFCLLARRLGLGRLPEGIEIRHVLGMSLVAGMGFTISVFVADLAFDADDLMARAKVGILSATLLAGLLGFAVLRFSTPRPGS